MTSRIGPESALATVGGMIEKTASIAASPPALPPKRLRAAARRMKKGKSAISAR
jgi:hypothetical protein